MLTKQDVQTIIDVLQTIRSIKDNEITTAFDVLPNHIKHKLLTYNPSQPDEPIQPAFSQSMQLSIGEYYKIISDTLGFKQVHSEFWIVVMRIVYLIMCIEKDPVIAMEIKQSMEEPTKLSGLVNNIFED